MSRHYLEASVRSIGFSKAIRLEQAKQIEAVVPLRTATSYDNSSNTVSEAILWELERTCYTNATREVDPNDKCERFALTLSEDEVTDDEEPMIFLPAATSAIEEQDSMAKSRSKQFHFIPYSVFLVEGLVPLSPSRGYSYEIVSDIYFIFSQLHSEPDANIFVSQQEGPTLPASRETTLYLEAATD